MRLSVVIPTYNRAGFVRECLASLRGCGVPDLEAIVSDDGSTDDTRAVVAGFPEARYLWHPNTGNPSAPRNRGAAAARGRYLAFLDCDDQWLPGAAGRAVELLDRHPGIGVLFAEARVGNPADGYVPWTEFADGDSFRKVPRTELEPGFWRLDRARFFRRMVGRNAVFTGAALVRREAFAAVGGFDPGYWGGEDWEVWTRLAHAHDFGFMAEPLANYTRHPGNVTNDEERMVGGFCQALANVRARCPLAADEARHLRGCLRGLRFGHAYLAYDRGDVGTARARFWRAVRAGDVRPVTLALAGLCLLPGPLARGVRKLKQTAAPGGRA